MASNLADCISAYRPAAAPHGPVRPHAGGWFVKTLDAPLHVHYAAASAFAAAEQAMLDAFAAGTSAEARAGLNDPARPIP